MLRGVRRLAKKKAGCYRRSRGVALAVKAKITQGSTSPLRVEGDNPGEREVLAGTVFVILHAEI